MFGWSIFNITADGDDVGEVATIVHGVIMGVEMPFPLANPDACVNSGLTCPLKKGVDYEYVQTLPVLRSYPKVSHCKAIVFSPKSINEHQNFHFKIVNKINCLFSRWASQSSGNWRMLLQTKPSFACWFRPKLNKQQKNVNQMRYIKKPPISLSFIHIWSIIQLNKQAHCISSSSKYSMS